MINLIKGYTPCQANRWALCCHFAEDKCLSYYWSPRSKGERPTASPDTSQITEKRFKLYLFNECIWQTKNHHAKHWHPWTGNAIYLSQEMWDMSFISNCGLLIVISKFLWVCFQFLIMRQGDIVCGWSTVSGRTTQFSKATQVERAPFQSSLSILGISRLEKKGHWLVLVSIHQTFWKSLSLMPPHGWMCHESKAAQKQRWRNKNVINIISVTVINIICVNVSAFVPLDIIYCLEKEIQGRVRNTQPKPRNGDVAWIHQWQAPTEVPLEDTLGLAALSVHFDPPTPAQTQTWFCNGTAVASLLPGHHPSVSLWIPCQQRHTVQPDRQRFFHV